MTGKANGRPKGGKDGDGATQPRPFKIIREAAGGWLVEHGIGRGTRRERGLEVSLKAPALLTPSGNLVGLGVVSRRGDTVLVDA